MNSIAQEEKANLHTFFIKYYAGVNSFKRWIDLQILTRWTYRNSVCLPMFC